MTVSINILDKTNENNYPWGRFENIPEEQIHNWISKYGRSKSSYPNPRITAISTSDTEDRIGVSTHVVHESERHHVQKNLNLLSAFWWQLRNIAESLYDDCYSFDTSENEYRRAYLSEDSRIHSGVHPYKEWKQKRVYHVFNLPPLRPNSFTFDDFRRNYLFTVSNMNDDDRIDVYYHEDNIPNLQCLYLGGGYLPNQLDLEDPVLNYGAIAKTHKPIEMVTFNASWYKSKNDYPDFRYAENAYDGRNSGQILVDPVFRDSSVQVNLSRGYHGDSLFNYSKDELDERLLILEYGDPRNENNASVVLNHFNYLNVWLDPTIEITIDLDNQNHINHILMGRPLIDLDPLLSRIFAFNSGKSIGKTLVHFMNRLNNRSLDIRIKVKGTVDRPHRTGVGGGFHIDMFHNIILFGFNYNLSDIKIVFPTIFLNIDLSELKENYARPIIFSMYGTRDGDPPVQSDVTNIPAFINVRHVSYDNRLSLQINGKRGQEIMIAAVSNISSATIADVKERYGQRVVPWLIVMDYGFVPRYLIFDSIINQHTPIPGKRIDNRDTTWADVIYLSKQRFDKLKFKYELRDQSGQVM